MLDAKVIGECLPRHRSREFVRFLKIIDERTPPELDLHLIVDNYSTHKSPPVKRWLKTHQRTVQAVFQPALKREASGNSMALYPKAWASHSNQPSESQVLRSTSAGSSPVKSQSIRP